MERGCPQGIGAPDLVGLKIAPFYMTKHSPIPQAGSPLRFYMGLCRQNMTLVGRVSLPSRQGTPTPMGTLPRMQNDLENTKGKANPSREGAPIPQGHSGSCKQASSLEQLYEQRRREAPEMAKKALLSPPSDFNVQLVSNLKRSINALPWKGSFWMIAQNIFIFSCLI